jgi:hypothetical protein
MLYLINSISDPYFHWIKTDPVRPNIPIERRVGPGRCIFTSLNEQGPRAITCVSFQNTIPKTEEQLFIDSTDPTIAVFYTIWNIQSGSASELLNTTLKYIKTQNSKIKKFLTLSPKTDMAHKFHMRNGASVYSVNEQTVNYEYQ